MCGHPHAARDLEEGHVPALRVEDVLVEHGLRLAKVRPKVRARVRVRARVETWSPPG